MAALIHHEAFPLSLSPRVMVTRFKVNPQFCTPHFNTWHYPRVSQECRLLPHPPIFHSCSVSHHQRKMNTLYCHFKGKDSWSQQPISDRFSHQRGCRFCTICGPCRGCTAANQGVQRLMRNYEKSWEENIFITCGGNDFNDVALLKLHRSRMLFPKKILKSCFLASMVGRVLSRTAFYRSPWRLATHYLHQMNSSVD